MYGTVTSDRGVGAEYAPAAAGELADIVSHPALMVPDLAADSKIAAIKELADRLRGQEVVEDSLAFMQAVLERENLSSTVLAEGRIALPHARGRMVRRLGLAMARTRAPIEFPSGDDRQEVGMICLIAVPFDAPGLYLRLLGALARVFGDADFVSAMEHAETAEEMQFLLVDRARWSRAGRATRRARSRARSRAPGSRRGRGRARGRCRTGRGGSWRLPVETEARSLSEPGPNGSRSGSCVNRQWRPGVAGAPALCATVTPCIRIASPDTIGRAGRRNEGSGTVARQSPTRTRTVLGTRAAAFRELERLARLPIRTPADDGEASAHRGAATLFLGSAGVLARARFGRARHPRLAMTAQGAGVDWRP